MSNFKSPIGIMCCTKFIPYFLEPQSSKRFYCYHTSAKKFITKQSKGMANIRSLTRALRIPKDRSLVFIEFRPSNGSLMYVAIPLIKLFVIVSAILHCRVKRGFGGVFD